LDGCDGIARENQYSEKVHVCNLHLHLPFFPLTITLQPSDTKCASALFVNDGTLTL
jgi:hypothetical protein